MTTTKIGETKNGPFRSFPTIYEESEREKPRKGRVVCTWCKKDMGEKEGLGEGQISRSICSDCRKKYFPRKTGIE